MRIIRDPKQKCFPACVAAIGNFDGVHLGHQALLSQMISFAKTRQLPSVAIMFEPQPLEFFRPHEAPARLTNWREKIGYLHKQGIDAVCCLRFNRSLSECSAQVFVEEILLSGLGIRALFVGEDFRFGHRRAGNLDTLQSYARDYRFDCIPIASVLLDNERISSTRVRHALAGGDFDLARRLLGRPFQLSGRVIRGDGRGRQIGTPTANIALRRLVSPVHGVFVVSVHGLDQPRYGVANIGCRPTVDGRSWWIETHILDFNASVYQQHIQVEPLAKLRDERKFANITELVQQIQQDKQLAAQFFI